jgi:pimeloyl-ACP methyl ester carboxylesterase
MRRKWWLVLALVVLLLVAAYLAVSWYFANIAISPSPRSLEEHQAQIGSPADFGLPQPEEIAIDTGEVTLNGWYFDNPAQANCGVMFMHGFTGTRYEALYWAPLFWERGCDVLAYDHRGHGESTPALLSYGFHEKNDALAARNWFAERTGLDPSRIGIGGVSYGAATALQLAPLVPEAPFILADSSYRSMPAIVRVRADELLGPALGGLLTPGALWVAGLRADFDPADAAPEATVAEAQMPILLIHSRTDEFTPYTHSEAIYANTAPGGAVLHVNDWGSSHAADIGTDFEAYQALFEAFMAEYAPDFGTAAP